MIKSHQNKFALKCFAPVAISLMMVLATLGMTAHAQAVECSSAFTYYKQMQQQGAISYKSARKVAKTAIRSSYGRIKISWNGHELCTENGGINWYISGLTISGDSLLVQVDALSGQANWVDGYKGRIGLN